MGSAIANHNTSSNDSSTGALIVEGGCGSGALRGAKVAHGRRRFECPPAAAGRLPFGIDLAAKTQHQYAHYVILPHSDATGMVKFVGVHDRPHEARIPPKSTLEAVFGGRHSSTRPSD